MRLTTTGLVLAAALSGIGATATAQAPASDPRVGTWRLNLAQSIPPQGTAFDPFVATVTAGKPGTLSFHYRATRPDGTSVDFSYDGVLDGKMHPLPGNARLEGSFEFLWGGIIRSVLRWRDGTVEDKACTLDLAVRHQTCIGTMTAPQGHVVFFKQVLDRI